MKILTLPIATPNYQREHNIQNDIRLWCGINNIPCFRCNVGRVKTEDGRFFDTGLPSGFSDLFILYNHTIYFIEVKTRKGKQREDQINFQNYVTSYGYTYIVARSVKDVIEGINFKE